MLIIAAHNPDSEVRRTSSAGGVFTIFAEHIISEGGVVYGVAFDENWRITHQRIDNLEDLTRLRGSKYAYSIIGTSIKDAMADLIAGRKVLFSGTPCQVAAMRKMAGDDPNLLAIEVVCHGAPEQKYWNKYLDELCAKLHRTRQDIESINFRDKRTGWKNYSFTIKFKDGEIFSEEHSDNLYLRAFSIHNLTLRKACFTCPFKYPNGSHTDITIGDFWGIEHIVPERNNDFGTTVIISNTIMGEKYTTLLTNTTPLSYEEVVYSNPAIGFPPTNGSNVESFQTMLKRESLLKALKQLADRSSKEKRDLVILKIKQFVKSILR